MALVVVLSISIPTMWMVLVSLVDTLGNMSGHLLHHLALVINASVFALAMQVKQFQHL
jgi:hypothetical protein